jgi:hypothetical protein
LSTSKEAIKLDSLDAGGFNICQNMTSAAEIIAKAKSFYDWLVVENKLRYGI